MNPMPKPWPWWKTSNLAFTASHKLVSQSPPPKRRGEKGNKCLCRSECHGGLQQGSAPQAKAFLFALNTGSNCNGNIIQQDMISFNLQILVSCEGKVVSFVALDLKSVTWLFEIKAHSTVCLVANSSSGLSRAVTYAASKWGSEFPWWHCNWPRENLYGSCRIKALHPNRIGQMATTQSKRKGQMVGTSFMSKCLWTWCPSCSK